MMKLDTEVLSLRPRGSILSSKTFLFLPFFRPLLLNLIDFTGKETLT